jgi:hypothetical protein
MRIILTKPNSVPVPGVFPPDYRQVGRGVVLFEGTSDKEQITGTFYHRVSGCDAIPYKVEGKFLENNGMWLTGRIPKMQGCQTTDSFPPTLHTFRNTSDYSMQ